MIPERKRPMAEEHGTVKTKYARFPVPVLRGMVLIVALCAFIPFLAGLLYTYEAIWVAAAVVFFLSSLTLVAMAPKHETLPASEVEETARQLRLPHWSLVTYFAITGLGFNWVCAFLWFGRRYALFSAPVIAVTGLLIVFYAAVGLLVARLTGGNWRAAVLVVILAPTAVAGIVLRLGLLR